MALDALGWTDHSQFILEGFMKLTQPSDLLLTATRSRGRALKWQNIWAALIVLNQQVCRSASILGGNRILLYCPPPPPQHFYLHIGHKFIEWFRLAHVRTSRQLRLRRQRR